MAKPRRRTVVLLFAVLAAGSAVAISTATAHAARSGSVPLTQVRDVPLPGNPTRFDYQSIDTTGRKLYLAHLGDSTLDVIDLDTLRAGWLSAQDRRQ